MQTKVPDSWHRKAEKHYISDNMWDRCTHIELVAAKMTVAGIKAPLSIDRSTSKNGEKHLEYSKESANSININR